MSGIINQVGARSGIISGGGGSSAGTVTLSGTTGLDYEEGTFTMTFNGGNDYTNPTATYIKIGNIVHFQFWPGEVDNSGSNGTLYGLPFTSVDDDYSFGPVHVWYNSAINSYGGSVLPNSTVIILQSPNAYGTATFVAADNQNIRLAGTYRAA